VWPTTNMNVSKEELMNLFQKTKETWLSRPERDTFIKMNNKVYKDIDDAFLNLEEKIKHETCKTIDVIKNIVVIIRIIKNEYEITKNNYFNCIMSSQRRKRRFV
jgi:hypothetical protein